MSNSSVSAIKLNSHQKEFTVVVPAAGVGARMQADRPKQYLPLLGKTVLEQTLGRLISHPYISKVVVVISREDEYWQDLKLQENDWLSIAYGGNERSDSVLNGLKCVTDEWVLVHDAARPCVRHHDINQLLMLADDNSGTGGILARQATDTMKLATLGDVPSGLSIQESVDRQRLWHALTPQFFPTVQLSDALTWCANKNKPVTDEASAIELTGSNVRLISGQADNIKITNPGDLALAEFYLQQQSLENQGPELEHRELQF